LGVWVATAHEYQDRLENFAKLDIEPSNFYGTGRGISPNYGMMFVPYQWVARADRAERPFVFENRAFGSNCHFVDGSKSTPPAARDRGPLAVDATRNGHQ